MARNVIFISPFPSEATLRFVRAVSRMDDVKLLGVVHTPPPDAASLFHDFVQVAAPTNVQDSIEAIELLKERHGEPYRIIGVLEAMTVHVAQVREHFGVPGTPSVVADLFRDKARMKDALRAAGLPVARHRVITALADAREFGAAVGYPIIVKPLAGLGSRATFRVRSEAELTGALSSVELPVLAEEMLVGTEHTMETITIGGEPKIVSFARYYPSCLEALENPWIQWACAQSLPTPPKPWRRDRPAAETAPRQSRGSPPRSAKCPARFYRTPCETRVADRSARPAARNLAQNYRR